MKRNMTLMELNDIIGARIRVTLESDELTKEQRENEYEKTRTILEAGKQMINTADIAMRYEVHMAKTNNLVSSRMEGILGE